MPPLPLETRCYKNDALLASLAVHRAVCVAEHVRSTVMESSASDFAGRTSSCNKEVQSKAKADASPVSVADFAIQCLLIGALHAVHPTDRFIGEESADMLRVDAVLRRQVWELVCWAEQNASVLPDGLVLPEKLACALQTNNGEEQSARLAVPETEEDMMKFIDMGYGDADEERKTWSRGRIWTIDPIDGTKTYVEGGQYAVNCTLLEDGEEVVGVLGCPHLSLRPDFPPTDTIPISIIPKEDKGFILTAIRGKGTRARSIAQGIFWSQNAQIDPISTVAGRKYIVIAENYRSSSSTPRLPPSSRESIAREIGAKWPTMQVYSTQMLYAAVATGHADVLLRIPGTKRRIPFVWDHAGGMIILREITRGEDKGKRWKGGKVTDIKGKEIDVGAGRQLVRNAAGIVASATEDIHAQLMPAVSHRVEECWNEREHE